MPQSSRQAALTLILKMEMLETAKWRAMQKPARVTQLPYMPSKPDRQNMPPKACNASHTALSVLIMFTTACCTATHPALRVLTVCNTVCTEMQATQFEYVENVHHTGRRCLEGPAIQAR